MQQNIIEGIPQQLQQQTDIVQKAAKEGFKSIRAEFDKQEPAFKPSCDAAIAELEGARATWHEKRDRVNEDFERLKASTHHIVSAVLRRRGNHLSRKWNVH
jgi:malate synthase